MSVVLRGRNFLVPKRSDNEVAEMISTIIRTLKDFASPEKQCAGLKDLVKPDTLLFVERMSPQSVADLTAALESIFDVVIPKKPPRFSSPLLSTLLQSLVVVIPHLIPSTATTPPFLSKLYLYSFVSDGPLKPLDAINLLSLLDTLTNPPKQIPSICLVPLVQSATHVAVKVDVSSKMFAHALAILSHISGVGALGLRAIQRNPHFKTDLWPKLYGVFQLDIEEDDTDDDYKTRNLIHLDNFINTVDVDADAIVITYALMRANSLLRAVLKGNNTERILELITLMESITKQFLYVVGPDPTVPSIPDNKPYSRTGLIHSYLRTTKETVSTISRKEVLEVEMLGLIAAVLPEDRIPDMIATQFFEGIYEIIKRLERNSTQVHFDHVYAAYHRMFAPTISMDLGRTLRAQELLVELVESIQIRSGTSSVVIRQNTSAFGILTIAQKLALQGCVTLKDVVPAKLLAEVAVCNDFLTELISSESTPEVVTCVVELLSLLADASRSKPILDILLKALSSNGGAAKHLSVAIRSANPTLVTKALAITGTVAFSRDNLKELSDALVKINCKEAVSSPQNGHNGHGPAESFDNVDHNMPSISEFLDSHGKDASKDGEKLGAGDVVGQVDVVTMFESRMQVADMQLNSYKDQITNLNKINQRLTELLTQNGTVMARQLAEHDLKDERISTLKQEIDGLRHTVLNQEQMIEQGTEHIQKKLSFKQKQVEEEQQKLQSMEKRVAKLVAEKSELEIKVHNYEETKKAVDKDFIEVGNTLQKRNATIDELGAKIKKLEKQVQEGVEEQKRMEHLLAKEKQTVDVIRGILGQNGQLP